MDDAGHESLTVHLPAAANRLLEDRGAEIDEIVTKLIAAGPIP
jgi:hypothetical protein